MPERFVRGLHRIADVPDGSYVEAITDDRTRWVKVSSHDSDALIDDDGRVIEPFISKAGEQLGRVVVTDNPAAPLTISVPDWDDYFLRMSTSAGVRGKCRRRQVGAIVVDEHHRIIATGYNGAPSGIPDCLEGGCPPGLTAPGQIPPDTGYDSPGTDGYCPASHAETNALANAVASVRGATCYVTHQPCPSCWKALAASGITRAVWPEGQAAPFDVLMGLLGLVE
ncbi:hypothetical protein EU513_00340 [Yimella sp. RIT 621]|uniref:deoxycytidylate deaminase n=1 Tax=Yimella sp. RIT 621 TaxID=2510323 RepID=UPI00101CD784|nr:deaminase [Yimella sp. RIT 621]RYG78793.1 hypothetical protein EU513_00340 [Yimella sp. RIT 621]